MCHAPYLQASAGDVAKEKCLPGGLPDSFKEADLPDSLWKSVPSGRGIETGSAPISRETRANG
jgi:hypothetical protein